LELLAYTRNFITEREPTYVAPFPWDS
jgi:hypothetical protein